MGDPQSSVGGALLRAAVLGAPALLALLVSTCRPAVVPQRGGFDVTRAAATVHALTRDCPERRPGGACRRRALRIIYDALAASGVEVQSQTFGSRRERDNLYGLRRGRRGGEVILAAHHDTVPGSPGALDDAAGVAVVLEVARVLGRRADGRTVRFALYDGEEDGLLGSRAEVRARRRSKAALPGAVVSVEMPGASGGAPVLHTFGSQPPPAALLARALSAARAAGADLGVADPLLSVPVQVLTRSVRVPFASDHTPFAALGVPAVMLSGASFTSFTPHYHAATDGPEQLDRRGLANAGRATLAVVRELAFGEELAPDGSRQWLALGTRVARGPALWVAAVLALLPLLAMARRTRPGGLVVLAVGATGALLLEPAVALALLGPGLGAVPLFTAPRAVARAARVVALLPAAVTALVWLVACARFGFLSSTLGVGRVALLLAGVAGLAMVRPGRPRQRRS